MRAARHRFHGPSIARSVRTVACAAGLTGWASAGGCAIDLSDNVEGRPCTPSGDCLDGYRCVQGRCVIPALSEAGTGLDGASARETGRDAGNTLVVDASQDTEGRSPEASAADAEPHDGAGHVDSATEAGDSDAAAPSTPDGGNPWPGVVCHGELCGAGELCCLSNYPGYPTLPDPDDFSCTAGTESCEYSLHCDGDHDCAANEACCATESGGGWTARCEPTCGSSDFRLGCSLPEHCGDGEQCCATWQFIANRFVRTVCQAGCGNPPNRTVCKSDADCGSSLSCEESSSLPGYTICL